MKPQAKGRSLLQARSRRRSSFFLLVLSLLVAGCRSSNNELLETALRMREQDLQTMREELAKLESQNQAMQRELGVVYPQATTGVLKVSPEFAAQTFYLKRITLGRSTGGYDDGRKPGDEALQVVIEPRDNDDHIVKAPAAALITALEINSQGLKIPIGSWNISQSQMRASWKQGLFTTGYILVLPWQQQPHSKNVRVVVRFDLADGRVFEADRDVIVRLPPEMPKTNGYPMPPMKETLPIPNPVNPGSIPPPGSLPIPNGPALQPTGHWQVPSLEGAIRLRRPVPLYPEEIQPD